MQILEQTDTQSALLTRTHSHDHTETSCRVRTGGRGRHANAHAGVDYGDVVVAAVGLLELAHKLVLAREGDRHARQHLMRLQVHLPVAQEEVLRRYLHQHPLR